jgi:hypothetical protein
MAHLLDLIPCGEVERSSIELPERERHEDYVRQDVPASMMVPDRY